MSRKPRRREQVIPFTELGFDTPSGSDTWDEDPFVTNDFFQNRQVPGPFVAKRVDTDIKFAKPGFSVLQDVRKGRFRNIELHRSHAEMSRTRIETDATSLSELPQPKLVSNLPLFRSNVETMRNKLKYLKIPSWIRHAVVFPIGPENMERIRNEGLPAPLIGYNSMMITYNNHHTSTIFIEDRGSIETTKRQFIEILNRWNRDNKPFLMASSNAAYAMNLSYGLEPEYIASASDTQYAIVFDDFNIPYGADPRMCVERQLKTRIRQTRLLTRLEMRWVLKRTARNDLGRQTLRLIEFESVEDRQRAVACRRIQVVTNRDKNEGDELFYCPMVFNRDETYEEVALHLQYDLKIQHKQGARVTLTYESDKDQAEKAFFACGFRTNYFDENNQREDLRLSPNCRSVVYQDFPKWLSTFERRRWFIERVAKANRLQVDLIEPHFEEVPEAYRSICRARTADIMGIINYEVYNIAYHHEMYRPMETPWHDMTNGRFGARHFVDPVMERNDVPWSTERKGPPKRNNNNRDDERYVIRFQQPNQGIRLVQHIINTSRFEPIFRCDIADPIGPQITPTFRVFVSINRQMRAVHNTAIRTFDEHLRHFYSKMSDEENPQMLPYEAAFFSARVFETWTSSEVDNGMIGVEGWSPECIRNHFRDLQALLKPKEFIPVAGTSSELLYGVGEVFVKSMEHKFPEVLVDIDKFRGIISIFGSDADNVIQELRKFEDSEEEVKRTVHINTQIDTDSLHGFDGYIRDATALQKLSSDLNAKISWNPEDWKIEFRGTWEAYQLLTEALSLISSDVYTAIASRNYYLSGCSPQPVSMTCPACFCEAEQADYFKFHCGHAMCRACLNNMVSSRIDEPRLKIKCEHANCDAFLTPMEIKQIILGGSDRLRALDAEKVERLVTRAKQALINSSADYDACRSADCVGILKKDTAGDPLVPKECTTCHIKYCRRCLNEPHPEETCQRHAELRRPDVSIAAYVESVGSNSCKKCPNCSAYVSKNDGCNHMECKCGAHWCWVCSYIASSRGDCYAHMNRVHDNLGGEFQMVDGQLQANPGNEHLQAELDMQRLLVDDGPPGLVRRQQPRFPPGIRPPPIIDFPPHLIREFPDFFGNDALNRHAALEYLNEAMTIEEQAQRMEHLRAWP